MFIDPPVNTQLFSSLIFFVDKNKLQSLALLAFTGVGVGRKPSQRLERKAALCLTAKERSYSRGEVNWVKQDNLHLFIINVI